MGLAGPKNKRKLNEDPNNTKWSRNENTFGQRMLRAQGWTPGQNLGAQDAAHASYHTAASSAPIKVVVKDDFLGLGAKIRQKQSDECTGLDVFKDLLGRLNGKSEESIEKERKVRSDIKTNLYVENKFGLMRFVSGGLLAGDQMQDLVTKKEKEDVIKTEAEEVKVKEEDVSDSEVNASSSKKDKKSKKRKAGDDEQEESRKEKSRDKKKRKKSEAAGNEDDSTDESSKKKKKKKSKSSSDSDEESAKAKDKKKKRKEKKLKEAETAASAATSDAEEAEKRRKREKKEKKRRKLEAEDTTASSTPMVVDTPAASGTATPVETGTSTPTAMSARHYARSRNIASKRQAMADMKSLNQIFMVKPV
ncbi:uncharacterized protein B0I36DRAFT_326905 [Microdochium trichocladiopsis]|uniref:PinX1-related protein 1 n=1 Tax=Microdochium trichocladiopsis TaxID=1682393 RepID=A0A9P9BKS5_9PEZI|nr:uncharacterized protein B0I36DRAFT_326905 [Microdochium trichocladiopsis]KAH7027337.1 hypothetical protein B0I36DRAFT_326905 [Microdochium trichocladiopsis]